METRYFDSSVLLSMLFSDGHAARALDLWSYECHRVTSRLALLECTTVVHRYVEKLPLNLRSKERRQAFAWLDQISQHLIIHEIDRTVTEVVAEEEMFGKCRTLDAIHLATAKLFQQHSTTFSLATFDQRMEAIGVQMGFQVLK